MTLTKEQKETLEHGAVHCRVVCEIVGAPESHVKESMDTLIDLAKKLEYADLTAHEVVAPKEQDNKYWSTFTEMDLLFDKKEKILDFCYTFLPSSVEVLAPDEMTLDKHMLTQWINEMQSRVHATDKVAKEAQATKKVMNTRLAQVVRYNLLSHLIEKPLSVETLKKRVGIDQKSFDNYLQVLLERGEVLKDKDETLRLSEVVNFDATAEKTD